VDLSKQATAILSNYVLTPGARYVPTLNSTVRLRNTREAHREHLRLWAKLMRCKEYHEFFDHNDEYYRARSYAGGYQTIRLFEFDHYRRPRLLDTKKVRCPMSVLKNSLLMRYFPKHDEEWVEYASNYEYGSKSKIISFNPGHASVYASNEEKYSFPMLELVSSSTFDSMNESESGSSYWRRYRID